MPKQSDQYRYLSKREDFVGYPTLGEASTQGLGAVEPYRDGTFVSRPLKLLPQKKMGAQIASICAPGKPSYRLQRIRTDRAAAARRGIVQHQVGIRAELTRARIARLRRGCRAVGHRGLRTGQSKHVTALRASRQQLVD